MPNYLLAQLDQIPPTPCPCGQARRAFAGPDNQVATIHLVDIAIDAQTHYHKKLTEIYLVLDGEGHLELDGKLVPVKPMTAVMIKPGCRHRAVGKLRIINIPVPAFDSADEWFDDDDAPPPAPPPPSAELDAVDIDAYCLGCFYCLRGLTARRCPECGRAFDVKNPATYSLTPQPQRVRKLVKQTTATLSDVLHMLMPAPTDAQRQTVLEKRFGMWWRESAALKLKVDLLINLLGDRGLLADAEIARLFSDLESEAAAAAMTIVDDAALEFEESSETPELLDLGRAASEASKPQARQSRQT